MRLSELKKNCSQMKDEIKALGNVNVNAIDDYKEISEDVYKRQDKLIVIQTDDITLFFSNDGRHAHQFTRLIRKEYRDRENTVSLN